MRSTFKWSHSDSRKGAIVSPRTNHMGDHLALLSETRTSSHPWQDPIETRRQVNDSKNSSRPASFWFYNEGSGKQDPQGKPEWGTATPTPDVWE
jgi:hypothetical protein